MNDKSERFAKIASIVLFVCFALFWTFSLGWYFSTRFTCNLLDNWISAQENHSVSYMTGFHECRDLVENGKESIYFECSSEDENMWINSDGKLTKKDYPQPKLYHFVTYTRDKTLRDFSYEEIEQEFSYRVHWNLNHYYEGMEDK